MRFEFNLAVKFFRLRRRSLARFTAIIAVAGIAAGIGGLITAQALARGFQTEMQSKLLANTPHITIYQAGGEEIKNWKTLKSNLETLENITEISPTSYENSILVSGAATSYAVLRVNEKAAFAENPNSDSISVAIGRELAEKMNLKIGDEAEIILPTDQARYAPKTAKIFIASIFTTGIYDYDSTWIYVSLENLAGIRQAAETAPGVLSVSVRDIYKTAETAENLRRELSDEFKIIDWQQANRPLFAALSLEKKVVSAIILLITFIAVLNVTTTLALIINERRADIAVLRTCGAKTKSIVMIFLFEGIFLGIAGIVSGVFLGMSVCFFGNYFRIIALPNEVYSLSHIPLLVDSADIFAIICAALFLVLISTILPARHAARIKPSENLRIR